MGMTRRDYELLATSLKECKDLCIANPEPKRTKAEVVEEVSKHLAYELMRDNPRFDRERFLKACGVEGQ